ncbi:MAG: hypothetical protein PVI38_18705 [Desulfobacterales bacterium]|jgi:hypothetical protein
MPGAFLIYPIVGIPEGIPEGATPVVEITALEIKPAASFESVRYRR